MKYNLLIYGVFAVIALVVLVSVLRPLKSRSSVTQEHFDLLRPDMLRAEVERLLDGPPRNGLRYPAIIWLPQAAGRPISAEIGSIAGG